MFSKLLALTSFVALAAAQLPFNPGNLQQINPGVDATMCLTGEGDGNGALVNVRACTFVANQLWNFTGGAVTLLEGTKCLDVVDGVNADGTKVQLWDCVPGSTNQQWYYTADNRLAWTGMGKCLDLTDGSLAPGSIPQIWTCTDGDTNQVWNSVAVGNLTSDSSSTVFYPVPTNA